MINKKKREEGRNGNFIGPTKLKIMTAVNIMQLTVKK